LIFAEVEAGSWLLTGRLVRFDVDQARATGAAGFAEQLFVGSLAVGGALSLLGFVITWLIVSRRGPAHVASARRGEFEAALQRTRERYRAVDPQHRNYVRFKLALDPLFELIEQVPGDWGRVLDLGCGRGQLSLLLLELGRASSVRGVDSDAAKVAAASAAGPEALFEVADLARCELPPADTILLIDVLHYLPLEEQDAVLQAALAALAPGGRIVVRELDASRSAKSFITRFCEWCGRKLGVNRGRATGYRPAADFVRIFEQAGLRCEVQGASENTPFSNVLIIAGGSPRANVERSASAPSTRTSAANA
jgi:SAM-dependent methyltransferase